MSYFDILSNNINLIKDEKMKIAFESFVEKLKSDSIRLGKTFYYKKLINISEILINEKLKHFDWGNICKIVNNNIYIIREIALFLGYLSRRNEYSGIYEKNIIQLEPFLSNGKVQTKSLKNVFCDGFPPFSYYYSEKCKNKADKRCLIKFNTYNAFINEILKEFICSIPLTRSFNCMTFFGVFELSLKGKKITSVKDFNSNSFDIQFTYFSQKKEKKNLDMLTAFYIFLLIRYNYEEIFRQEGNLDINMLKRQDFVRIYSERYKGVLYNPNENVPIIDKWLLIPNGYENTTTRINANDYKKIDFSVIEDKRIKQHIKMWFWHSNSSFKLKIRELSNIITFANFLNNYRRLNKIPIYSNNIIEQSSTITQSEIFQFRTYVFGIVKTLGRRNDILGSVKRFMEYLEENQLMKVEYGVYYYLKQKRPGISNRNKAISEEHLIILEKKLREKADESYKNTLYFIIFHIALNTEFRISVIINLQIDCISEAMKKNQYIIKSRIKQSYGEIVEQPISLYTKRMLEDGIQYTRENRQQCYDKYLSKFIFIYRGYRGIDRVIAIEEFNKYLKMCCQQVDLPVYTSKSLRSSYLSRAGRLAIEEGWSLFELLKITNHKHYDTLNNHYIDIKIRECLEATHGVIIGDINIVGQAVKESTIKKSKENIVDEGCGLCNSKSCNLFSNLECPLCTNYVATVDNIPYFEEKIRKLDKEILDYDIAHDREHLYNIKSLYVAYLERLYTLEAENQNE